MQDRINAGLASSIAMADMIAVGTSHGYILAFDNLQALRWCCQEYTSQGAVSALAFNDGSTRLLAGFARGQIIMIDTSSGDVLRSMPDVITPNSGVLHLKWTEGSSAALCSDSGGSVWTLNFTRRLGIRGCDSRCIFSGARGEVGNKFNFFSNSRQNLNNIFPGLCYGAAPYRCHGSSIKIVLHNSARHTFQICRNNSSATFESY